MYFGVTFKHNSSSIHLLAIMLVAGLSVQVLLLWFCCHAAEVPEDASAEFWVRLYHQLRIVGGEENIIFSPLSMALALGMVELGARGSSLEQIRLALGYTRYREDEEFAVLRNLTLALSGEEPQYVVRLANSLFLQRGVEFSPDFLKQIQHYFLAEAETVDFNQSASVAQQINSWVQNHTENKIHDLVSADDFSGLTRATLINAMYFRGTWKNQFRPENTRTFSFSKDDGSEVQTLMMYLQGDFHYGEFSDGSSEAGGLYQVLEMLYEGEEMSMIIVLPRQEVPLATLEPIIKASLIEEWAGGVKKQKVEVYLPRFKVEQTVDLKVILQQMGIRNIFTKEADLSGMTVNAAEGKNLFIGKAVQKSYLEVTEEGAEGATGSGMTALTRMMLYPQVMADHPFFFVIRNRKTGSILFMGRVMNPEVVESFDLESDSQYQQ